LLVPLLAAACSEPDPPLVYQAIPVERRDIVVSAQAAGTVEPEIAVEVKSKASGEILELRVETGELVQRGSPMVRIDQRQPRNVLAQAEAELKVARAGLANASSQLRRARELFGAQSISETAYDEAVLAHANAVAEVVRARVAVENAQIELDDTEILAPITGTIIEKNVERGQVISSPTQDVAGGTLLLKMADLDRVQVRTLVDETDIGKIQPGLRATVTAAAYPDRPFEGEVLKIEPQSVTEQNVTMFPVLVGVDNRDGRMRPGMNCEVEVHVGMRKGVLAVPNAALRTPGDVGSAAGVLGLSEQEVERQLALASGGAPGPPAEAADAGGHADEGEPAPEAGEGFAFGGRYIVFVLRDAGPTPVNIRTGLTDLDFSEVVEGLSESDSVLVLPSAGLVRSQQRFQERVRRVTGDGLPGVRSRKR
jgi:HlyD family secretion protein